jgi:hypothetical protein
MQRRARIKAVANLSSTRRGLTKTKSDKQSDPSNLSHETDTLTQVCSAPENVNIDNKTQSSETSQIDITLAGSSPKHINVANYKAEQIPESTTLHHQIPSKEECTTFKAPLQLPRLENDGPSPSHPLAGKMRRFKVAPRLNSRSFHKPQVSYFVAASLDLNSVFFRFIGNR